MAAPTQLIFTDTPGDLPATYTVPASSEIILSSVFARFDGSGAGGDFLATLDLLSQSGNLMARVAINSQTLAAGDSARATWAPFLRRQAASAAPGGTSLSFGTAIKATSSLTPINASFHEKVVDLGTGTSFRTNDSTRLQLVDDTPHTPTFGIRIPHDLMVQVCVGLDVVGGTPDGQHSVQWVAAGASAVRQEGPTFFGTQAGGWTDHLVDDFSGPQSLLFVDHLSSVNDYVLGIVHTYDNWTNGAHNFHYGITVSIIGDRPN